MQIKVHKKPASRLFKPYSGLLLANGRPYSCTLGRSGIVSHKHEGDGGTPHGTFRILYGYYRSDRISRPKTALPLFPIRPDMGWCDDPQHPQYNREIRLPFCGSHEKLYRQDQLYDVFIVLDYNIWPRKRQRGSAIFFHLTNLDRRVVDRRVIDPRAFDQRTSERKATEGCVALDYSDMLAVLRGLQPGSKMQIQI